MKFTIRQEDIKDILQKVQGLTNRKTSLAITETVIVKARGSKVSLVATDMETGFEGSYPAKVETEGEAAINAKKLFEIVRDFPSEEIVINEVENRWIEIGDSKVQFNIMGMDPEEYPEIPLIEEVDFFGMESFALKNMMEKTACIPPPPEDTRAHMSGVYMEKREEGKALRVVSTDGSRLSMLEYPVEGVISSELGVLAPKKGLLEAGKFLSSEGNVKVGVKDAHLVVMKESETITVRLLEGDYPRYGDIVADKGGHLINMKKKDFLMLVKRMSILTTDNYKGVVFNFADNKLLVTVSNPEIGESKEDIDIEFQGDTIEVAFNPKFFRDALNLIDDDIVKVTIVDEENPCLLRGENDNNFLSVIMPMKI